ncbi:hypothetical protein K8I31_08365 [bacterium]|nr:hypothetical protein [bacterium]
MNKTRPLQTAYVRFLSSAWFPLTFTLFVFCFKAPYMDLPVHDDGSVFYNGWRILNGDYGARNFQWSPVLAFVSAAIQFVLPHVPIEGFFLFHAIGHITIALGGYFMLRALGMKARYAAPVAAAWCGFIHAMGVMMEFPTLHLYHTGVPLLIGAYLLRAKPISLMTGLGLAAFTFLLRNEAVLVMLILLAAGAVRRRNDAGLMWKRNIPASLVVWAALFASLWLMNQDARNWQGGRMEQAFRQKFYVYALSTLQYDAVFPMTYESEFRVLERAFGDGASDMSVPALLFRNPSAFLGFMNFNAQIILRGELGYDDNHWLISYYITIVFICGCFATAYAALRRRQLWIALLLVTLLLKVPLLLITVPRVRYFGDALFIAMFAAWPLLDAKRGARWSDGIACLLVLLTAYSLAFLPAIKPLGVRPNLVRALFVQYADRYLDFDNKSIAENYPTFSTAFGSRGLRESFAADDFVHSIGGKLYGRDGKLCDYILLEDGLPVVGAIGRWGAANHPLLSKGPLHLYTQSEHGAPDARPRNINQPVWATDDYLSEQNFAGRIDADEFPGAEIAVKWNAAAMGINSASEIAELQVLLEVNGDSQLQPLGVPHQKDAGFLEWEANSPLVHPLFKDGPQFGAAYRFHVYAKIAGQDRFGFSDMTDEPVRVQSYVTVNDSTDSRFDLSGSFDADLEEERMVVVRWDLPQEVSETYKIIDYHVYVRVNGEEDVQYLGQAQGSDIHYLEWKPGNKKIAPAFRQGPQFNNQYEFLVYIIPEERMKTPKVPYRNFAPVQYIDASQAGESLPSVSTQKNGDEIRIHWQYGPAWLNEHPVNGFDVYVHQKGAEDVLFLGRSGADNPGELYWRQGGEGLAEHFKASAPSNGEYEFAVYPLLKTPAPENAGPIISQTFVQFLSGQMQ